MVRDRVATPPRDVWPALARLVKRVVAAAPADAGGVRRRMRRADGAGDAHGVAAVHPQRGAASRCAHRLDELTAAAGGRRQRCQGARARRGLVRRGVGRRATSSASWWAPVSAAASSAAARLLQGRVGNAGHIGHVVVEPDGRPCVVRGLRAASRRTAAAGRSRTETGRPPQRAPRAIVERTGHAGRPGRSPRSGAIVDLKLAVIGGSVALGFGESFFERRAGTSSTRAPGSAFISGFQVVPAALGDSAPRSSALRGRARPKRRRGTPATRRVLPAVTSAHATDVHRRSRGLSREGPGVPRREAAGRLGRHRPARRRRARPTSSPEWRHDAVRGRLPRAGLAGRVRRRRACRRSSR